MAITKSVTETLKVATTGATFYLKAELVENGTDKANNASNMTIKGTLSAKSGGSSFSGTGGKLYVDWLDNNDGSWHNKASKTITSLSSGKSSSTSSTFNIAHKTDGSLKGRVRVRWENLGTSYAPSDANLDTGAVSLTNIPRNSTIVGRRYDNEISDHILLLEVTRYSSDYTDTISWSCTNNGTTLTEVVQTKGTNTKIAVCFDDNAYNNVSVPSDYVKFRSRYSNEDLLNLLGNETQKPWIFSVSTYSGNTQIGNTYSATGSYVIVRSTYDIAATAIVTDSKTINLTGNTDTIIKGISNVNVTINPTKRQYYNDNSTISQYWFYKTYNGEYITTQNNNYPYEKVTEKDFYTNILDSRNLNSSLAKASITNFLEYFKPGISSLITKRAESTSTIINFDVSGVFWNNNFSTNNTNTISLKYRYKLNDGNWTEYINISSGVIINNNEFSYSGSFNPGTGTDSLDTTIEVVIKDLTDSEFSLKATEPKGSSLFDIGENYFNINTRFAVNHKVILDLFNVESISENDIVAVASGISFLSACFKFNNIVFLSLNIYNITIASGNKILVKMPYKPKVPFTPIVANLFRVNHNVEVAYVDVDGYIHINFNVALSNGEVRLVGFYEIVSENEN